MMTIDSKTKRFSELVAKDAGLAIDPTTIVTVIYVILEVAKFLQSCKKKPNELIATAKKPGLFDRLLIQGQVRRKLKGAAYNKYGKKIVEAILTRGSELHPDDLSEILKECQNENS